MNKQKQEEQISLWVGIGVAMGTVIGAVTDNVGLWLPMGIAIGAGLGLAFNQKEEKDSGSK